MQSFRARVSERVLIAQATSPARLVLMITALSILLLCAPALTTIQDVLYKADGTKFDGILKITWNSLQAGDDSNTATQSVTTQVVNGFLRVMLVPTTNASPPAVYTVVNNSDGAIQFTETWVVPPSNSPLHVAQSSDVAGLRTELNIPPVMGTAFAASRAAVIDSTGAIAAATGNLSDCIRVDGTSASCGAGDTQASGFIDAETPSGIVDDSNASFQLSGTPSPTSSLTLFHNGLALKQNSECSNCV